MIFCVLIKAELRPEIDRDNYHSDHSVMKHALYKFFNLLLLLAEKYATVLGNDPLMVMFIEVKTGTVFCHQNTDSCFPVHALFSVLVTQESILYR